jgi:hypothetical protein
MNFITGNQISKTLEIPLTDRLFRHNGSKGSSDEIYLQCIEPSSYNPTWCQTIDESAICLHSCMEHEHSFATWVEQSSNSTSAELATQVHHIMGHASTRALENLHRATIGLACKFAAPQAITNSCDACLKAK